MIGYLEWIFPRGKHIVILIIPVLEISYKSPYNTVQENVKKLNLIEPQDSSLLYTTINFYEQAKYLRQIFNNKYWSWNNGPIGFKSSANEPVVSNWMLQRNLAENSIKYHFSNQK
jgi:hypothetical protein